PPAGAPGNPYDAYARPLADYVLRSGKPLTGDPVKDQFIRGAVADRLSVLIDAWSRIAISDPKARVAAFKMKIDSVRSGGPVDAAVRAEVLQYARFIIESVAMDVTEPARNARPPALPLPPRLNYAAFDPLIEGLYASALPDDVGILDDLMKL